MVACCTATSTLNQPQVHLSLTFLELELCACRYTTSSAVPEVPIARVSIAAAVRRPRPAYEKSDHGGDGNLCVHQTLSKRLPQYSGEGRQDILIRVVTDVDIIIEVTEAVRRAISMQESQQTFLRIKHCCKRTSERDPSASCLPLRRWSASASHPASTSSTPFYLCARCPHDDVPRRVHVGQSRGIWGSVYGFGSPVR